MPTATTLPPRSEIPFEDTWDTQSVFPDDQAWEAACQQIIEQASAANVNWNIESETAVVIHKQCDAARGSKEDMSMPLEVELLWLLNNSGLHGKELTKAKQSAKQIEWFTHQS